MKTSWMLLVTAVSLILLYDLATAEESSCYLGRKLEFVLRQVDNSFVEQNKGDFATRHKKAFRDLDDYLTKNYPDFEPDLVQWAEENYAAELDKIASPNADEKRVSLNSLLALDRQDKGFRARLLAHVKGKYPRLLGQVACFLRDNHPATLREVLRMTLRMTSHVKPCVYRTAPSLPKAHPSPERLSANVPTED